MIKNLFFTAKLALFLVFSLLSLNLAAQTTMLEYRFGGNLNPTVAGPATTSLTYTSGTPAYSGGWLRIAQSKPNDYLELTTNTSGMQNMSLSFDGRLSALGLDASWIVETNYGSGTTFTELTRINFFSLVWIPFNRSLNYTLPATCENKTELKIRIRPLFDGSVAGNLDIDNLKITYGNPKIHISTNGNTTVSPNIPADREVPHLAAPSVSLDTDFGVKSPDMANITHRFRVRNLNGSSGSKLRIDSIVIEGANPGDFAVSPISLSDINQTTSATSNTYKTFDITFSPLEDGLRTAQVYLYSNAYGTGSNNPYIINVLGVGASCKLLPSDFAINKMEQGQQTLLGNYQIGDLIGGVAYNDPQNTLNKRLYPSSNSSKNNLYTSASTSWYVRNATKPVEFGPIDISNQKNVAISFKVAAFTTSNKNKSGIWNEWDYEENGLDHNSTIKVSVLKPDNTTWSQEMILRGAVTGQGTIGVQQYFRYGFDGNGTFTSTYSGTNPNNTQSNSSSTKYSTIVLNIPATANISNLKFKIEAKTDSNDRLWLIDDVKVLTSNAVFKTFTTGNVWSPSEPTQYEKAIIEGDYTNSGHAKVCECEVMEGGSLTIPNNTSVTLQGKLINHGNGDNVVVKDGGNLKQIENSAANVGAITVENTFTLSAGRQQYNYVISPVKGQSLKTIYNGIPFVIYHNENTNFFYNAGNGDYVAGKGFAVKEPTLAAYPADTTTITGKYKGEPYNGTLDYPIAYTTDKVNVSHGWNLIGNPYPSSLDLIEFYNKAGNKDKIESTFKFWDNRNNIHTTQQGSNYGGSNYALFNVASGTSGTGTSIGSSIATERKPTRYVKPGIAFIVRAKSTANGATLHFENSYRSVDAAPDFHGKQNAEQDDRFWLNLTSPTGITVTNAVVYFPRGNNDYASDDSDYQNLSDDIYTIVGNNKLAIQGKAPFEDTDVLPLGINTFKEGNYTISLNEKEGKFANGQAIYLKDKQLNIITNLSQGAYTFETTAGEHTGRFEIVYQPGAILGTQTAVKSGLVVYKDGADFVLKNTDTMSKLDVYDMSGRMIHSAKPQAKEFRLNASTMNNGVYILQVQTPSGIQAKRVIK